jgi:hypothetical protein
MTFACTQLQAQLLTMSHQCPPNKRCWTRSCELCTGFEPLLNRRLGVLRHCARREAAAKCARVASDENELEYARRASLICSMEYALPLASDSARFTCVQVRASPAGACACALSSRVRTQGAIATTHFCVLFTKLGYRFRGITVAGQTRAQSARYSLRLRNSKKQSSQFQAQCHQERGNGMGMARRRLTDPFADSH